MPDESSEGKLNSRVEASELLCEIAGPSRLGEGVKAALRRAHRRLAPHGFSFNRVRDIYHNDPRIRISADEMAQLRELAEKFGAKKERAGDEIKMLECRIEKLERALFLSDPDAYRALVAPQSEGDR